MVDDVARPVTAHGLAGAGGHHPAAIPARSSGGRAGRHPGPATHPARDSGVAGPEGRLAGRTHGDRRGPALDAPRGHARHRCGQRGRHPRVAGDDSRGRAEGGAAGERGAGKHRDQHRARGRTGRRRSGHRRRWTGAGVSHQRCYGAGRVHRAVAVAARTAPRHATGGAHGVRRARRHPVCPVHAGVACGHRPHGGVRVVRERALVAAALGREDIVGARTRRVRCPGWKPRPGGLLGAVILPVWRRRQSTDAITAVATVVFAVGCLALAWVREFGVLLGAMLVAGTGWLIVVSSLILAAQRGAAEWVRGRALAVSTLTLFGSFAVGALLWGVVADEAGIPSALMTAGGGLLLGLGLIPLFPLAAAEGLKLDPAHIWDDPVVAEELAAEAGPVLVTVEYTLEPRHRASFAAALRRQVRPIRQRDGAVFWELFVDAANPHHCVECYLVESWAEHLRQHGRTTQSDREVEDALRTFYSGRERVTHFVALQAPRPRPAQESRWRLVR